MNDYYFIYCFGLGGGIAWSCETEQTLLKRLRHDSDISAVKALIRRNIPGGHVALTGGELVFQSSKIPEEVREVTQESYV